MAWPVSQDYNEAIQDPHSSFNDPELKAGEAVTNALGMPMPRSGNFADVYEFNTPATKSKWAIKCFTRHVPGLRERYLEIGNGLLEAKLPFTVEFQYLVQGIRVRGEWFPILKMRWVEGLLLNEFVRDNLDKPTLLGNLGLIWCRMAKRLREANIAHADLQHGNVLLVPGSKNASLAVKLIDYDGMFVPSLAKKKSGEVGHPNYQHPQRLREGTYNSFVDRFPLLVVGTAMRALSVEGHKLWDRHDNGDNMLFKEADLKAPAQSALFKELSEITDPQTQMLLKALRRAIEQDLGTAPAIDELLSESKPEPKRKTGFVPTPPESVPEPQPPLPETAIQAEPPLAMPVTMPRPAEEAAEHTDLEETAVPIKKEKRSPLPLWGMIGCGAAVLFGVFVIAGAGALWALFGKGPVDQKKPGEEPVKLVKNDDRKKPPLIKEKNDNENKPGPGAKDQEIPPAPPGQFRPLFNQVNLNGWQVTELGVWSVVDGMLVGSGKTGACLCTNRNNFQNFHLRLEARATENTHANVLVRSSFDPTNPVQLGRGYATGIDRRTGVLTSRYTDFAMTRGGSVPIQPGTWFLLEIISEGKEITVKVDGKIVNKAIEDLYHMPTGRIVLEFSMPGSEIAFRKIEIQETSVGPPPTTLAWTFTPLFNGKDLTGWKTEPQHAADWRVENGILIGAGAGPSALCTERTDFKDFHLRVEMRYRAATDARLFFRTPQNPALQPFVPGYRAHITDREDPGVRPSGALSSIAINQKAEIVSIPGKSPTKSDDWFLLEIYAEGDIARVKINGVQRGVWDDSQKKNPDTGMLAFLLRDKDSAIEVRKIEIRESKKKTSPAPPPPIVASGNFTPLFNGKDLTGWKTEAQHAADWRVENGVLVGSGNARTTIFTERSDFSDFHLVAEMRYRAKTMAGLRFRWMDPTGLNGTGHATVIEDQQNPKGYATGSLRSFMTGSVTFTGTSTPHTKSDDWFKLEIIAEGDKVTVKVNGTITAVTDDVEKKYPSAGHLAFFLQKKDSVIEVRKIEIRESKPAQPPPPIVANGGFTPIFNGKDLTGWKTDAQHATDWRVENGILVGSGAGPSALLTERSDYGDFHLRVEMRYRAKTSAMLQFRGMANPAVNAKCPGYRMHIDDQLDPKDLATGALSRFFLDGITGYSGSRVARTKSDQWITLEVIAEGERVTVKVNGMMTAGYSDQQRRLPGVGNIAFFLQNKDAYIEVRKAEIREPKPLIVAKSGFTPLFNGKDLTGWSPSVGKENWRVENGILVGEGKGPGYLTTEQAQPRDFHLRMEMRLVNRGVGTIYMRASPQFPPKGYELTFDGSGTEIFQAGLRYVAQGRNEPVLPMRPLKRLPLGEWFQLELIAKEGRLVARIDGDVTTDVEDTKKLDAGHIVLIQQGQSRVEFRKIEISPLSDENSVKEQKKPEPKIQVTELKLNGGKVSVDSSITAKDPLFSGRKHKPYVINFDAGRAYQIDMTSKETDKMGPGLNPFLFLENPDGKIVGIDDDGGGGLNARLTYKATQSGAYRILCCSANQNIGDFTLTVTESPKRTFTIQGMRVQVETEGVGASAKIGSIVTLDYVGTLPSGGVFDSSISRKTPLTFALGNNANVIKGFELAIVGMKIGEKRRIVVPPALAYGAKGLPPLVPPNTTLTYEITLRKIN